MLLFQWWVLYYLIPKWLNWACDQLKMVMNCLAETLQFSLKHIIFCGAISSALYLLTRLEKEKQMCKLGCLAFFLCLESTVVRGFYSANKDGRTKLAFAACQRKNGYARDTLGISTQTLQGWKRVWRILICRRLWAVVKVAAALWFMETRRKFLPCQQWKHTRYSYSALSHGLCHFYVVLTRIGYFAGFWKEK